VALDGDSHLAEFASLRNSPGSDPFSAPKAALATGKRHKSTERTRDSGRRYSVRPSISPCRSVITRARSLLVTRPLARARVIGAAAPWRYFRRTCRCYGRSGPTEC
jgi:hypothetical protein